MPARPPPSIVMLQTVIRPSIESAAIAAPAYSTTWPTAPVDADLADRRENHVLGGHAEAELALVADPHRARLALHQALGGEHVLDLGGADPEGERAERAVRRGVGVAADDRHARLRHAQLGTDHVDDSLARRTRSSRAGSPNSRAVALERLEPGRARARRGSRRRAGVPSVGTLWSAVASVRSGRRTGVRRAAALEGLRARHLVHEVQVDVEQAAAHLVGVPDLVEHVCGIVLRSCVVSCAAGRRETTASRRASAVPGVLEMVRQVGVEGHAVAGLKLMSRAVADSTTAPALDERRLAAARLVHRRVVGRRR